MAIKPRVSDRSSRDAAPGRSVRFGFMATVLVVEDDEFVRSAIIRDLTGRSHAVRSAGRALDALREIAHVAPDVVVLDLGLPDLDGAEALKMLRAISDVPVIVATARDDEAEIVRLLRDGADDYLVKPFSGDHLNARLEAVLRRARPGASSSVARVGGLVVDADRREAASTARRSTSPAGSSTCWPTSPPVPTA